MAFEERLSTLTMISGADYSDGFAHYRFVVPTSTAKTFLRASVAGSDAVAICQDTPRTGEASCVADGGISKVVAGAAITAGAQIATDNQGRAVTATSGAYILGTAIQGAAAAGIIIPILFEKNGRA